MTVLQAIVLGFIISGLIIFLVLYPDFMFSKIKRGLHKIKAKSELKKLSELGYFKFTPIDDLDRSKNIFLSHFGSKRSLQQIWIGFEEELDFDYRSFRIWFNDGTDQIELESLHFYSLAEQVGLNIHFHKTTWDKEENALLKTTINETDYITNTKGFSYQDYDKSTLAAFVDALNTELDKIQSEEKVMLIEDIRISRLVFLNQDLINFISRQ